MQIEDFLLARIDEDEAHVDPTYHHFRNVNGIIESQGEPACCWAILPGQRVCILPVDHAGDRARLQAECEAKRRIVESQTRLYPEGKSPAAEVLRLLALPYAGHPEYRDEWRPDDAMPRGQYGPTADYGEG